MSDVVGRGIIELVADARQLKAGIDDAKKSIRTLGEGQKDISKAASASIDQYIGRLQMQQQTLGKSAREVELYKLAMRGASNEQLAAANSALRLTEAYQKGVVIGDRLKSSFVAFGAIAATGLIAAAVAFDQLTKKAGDFQDMAEKTGDSAENIASLAVAAKVGGIEMDAVVGAANKLTKGLSGVDDESKAAGAAIKALGLNIEAFKSMKAADQMETVAKALQNFEDGAGKSAVTMALFGKSGSEILPFLNELAGSTGRQNILTAEQIRLADEYADRQAKLKAQIALHAESIAVNLVGAYTDLEGAALDYVKAMTGVKDGMSSLAADDAIQNWADETAIAFAKVVDFAALTVKSISAIGSSFSVVIADLSLANTATKIGLTGMMKQSGREEFAAALKERNQTLEDANKKWEDLSNYNPNTISDNLDKRIKNRKQNQALASEDRSNPSFETFLDGGKPSLKYNGPPDKNAANTAAQEAKARLAAELADIKAASDATINTYTNAEKIMEVRRAAGILSEKEYYDAKRSFMALFSQEKEQEIQKEIARMQAEKLSGKEKIENDKKIADAQAKLAQIREDAAANSVVLSLQEEAANKKIAQSYVDAKEAADAYIASVVERNKRELEGIGRGTKFRDEQAGRNEIEDKFIGQRQTLERDRRNGQITQKQFDDYLAVAQQTYQKEIDLYDERTQAINDASGNWANGAAEAMQNYYDHARDIAGQTEEIFTRAFGNMEDALVDFVKTGKLDFKSLMDSIIADMARAAIKQNITGPLSGWLSGLFSGLGGVSGSGMNTGVGSGFNSALWGMRASGGPVSAGGTYLVGEKGPELLQMGSQSGNIVPNHMLGGGFSVVINNTVSDQAQANVQPRMNNGKLELEVMIEKVLSRDMQQNGRITQGFSNTFGLARAV